MVSRVAHLPHRSARYFESGGGRALVLLHAFPLSADQWLPQLHRVPPGWRVVAPDLRGFRGAGPAFEDVGLDGLTIDGYADDVLALMSHLEIERAVVAGLSMGGYVALSIAARAPQRLSGLVLANSRATADTPAARANRDRMIASVEQEGSAVVTREMVPKLLGKTTRAHQADLVETVEQMIDANASEGMVAAIRALRDRPDRTGMLSSIGVPTLVISGAEDEVIPLQEAEAMARAIPGARLVVLAETGHLSNLEDPPRFNAALHSILPSCG